MKILLLITSLLLGNMALAAPEVGDQAPAFSLPGSDGNTHALSDYIESKSVVIAFFPRVFTGG